MSLNKLKPNCGFSRDHRLLVARDFSQVFEQRQVKKGQFFSLHWLETTQLELGQADIIESGLNFPIKNNRLGVVIAKKLLKTAVHRNLLKRICREKFRQFNVPENINCSYDFVIRLTVKLNPGKKVLDRKAIAIDVDKLFNSIYLFKVKNAKT